MLQLYKKNTFKGSVALLIAVLFIVFCEFYQHRNGNSLPALVENGEKSLAAVNGKMDFLLTDLSKLENEDDIHNFLLHGDLQKDGLSFYVLQNDSLKYWSNNEPVVSAGLLDSLHHSGKVVLQNGDFLFRAFSIDNRKYIGMLLLRANYPYENRYLDNHFNPKFLPEDISISADGIPFHLPDGSVGYTVVLTETGQLPGMILLLYWLAVFLGLTGIYFLLRGFAKGNILRLLIGIVAVTLLRVVMISLRMPDELYNLQIFSPQYYASSLLFNSLGDLLLNVLLLLVYCILLFEVLAEIPNRRHKGIVVLIWIGASIGLHCLIYGIVINSKIIFDLSTTTYFDPFSFLAFGVLAAALIGYYFLTAAFFRYVTGSDLIRRYAGIFLVLISAYAAVNLSVHNSRKEKESRKLLAQKVDMRQDHVAEYLFDDIQRKISADAKVLSILHHGPRANEQLTSYLSQKYFTGYLTKFDMSAFLFDSTGAIKEDKTSLESFRQQITKARPTYSDRLYFLSNESGTSSYIGILQLNSADSSSLVITMNARILQQEEGFPELFISNRYKENLSTGDYSVARYRDGALIYEFGNYVYSLSSKEFGTAAGEFNFVDRNGYNHLVYRMNPNSTLVLSKPADTILGELTLFSWLLTTILIVAFFLYTFSFLNGMTNLSERNLTRRIQNSVIFLVVFSFILIGAGTVYNINNKYANDQRKSISDQVNALWFSVSETGFDSDSIQPEHVMQLDRLSANTNINFNIFSKNGSLIYSSESKIFENGIIAPLMNPEAYFEIKEKSITQFIHPEKAGKLKYIAAYAPLTNHNGKLSAFLNLPYFEKQNELNKEISGFLSALLNIYVLLFAVAVLITVIISSQITKPLLLIQEKMSGVRFGVVNEQIEYHGSDEIGRLVKEYNRMLEQLAVSADKLAQSERESAWREMAKQVAHEIKNPLTPMKLSIQHLQRTYKESGPPTAEAITRLTENLIQQIDTLAHIATAFSDFAKLPQTDVQEVDLIGVLHQLVGLYNEMPGVKIEMLTNLTTALVKADKDQLIRMYTNILKNAVQSIPENRQGQIEVKISQEGEFYKVDIKDNGVGIPEDQQDKIFKPNFTTKSSGMGLGLAMVRNMINQINGNISFASTYGVGSTFTTLLPKS